VRSRQLQLDDAAAIVESSRRVDEDLGVEPFVAVRDLPAKRRVLGVDAGSARPRAVHFDLHDESCQRRVEAQIERVAELRRAREGELVGPLRLRAPMRDADVLELVRSLDDVRGRKRRGDREAVVSLKNNRLIRRRPQRAHLGRSGNLDLFLSRLREPKPQLSPRGRRRLEVNAEQVEQPDVQLVGDSIESVDERLGHPGEELDQRDPWVRDVVLGPLRAALRDLRACLVHEILETPVVERDLWQPHAVSSAGMT
jgi:hypothetical protein